MERNRDMAQWAVIGFVAFCVFVKAVSGEDQQLVVIGWLGFMATWLLVFWANRQDARRGYTRKRLRDDDAYHKETVWRQDEAS
jgi:hypothetical protein